MREILICIALAAVAALVVPAFAQTSEKSGTVQHYAHGGDSVSK